jgi:hypothetical protein
MTEPTRAQRTGWRVWPWPALTIVGVLGLLTAVIVSATMNAEPSGLRTAVTSGTTTPAPTTNPPNPRTTFGHGLVVVGVDVLPGTYRTPGPTGTGNCYWSRYSADGARLLDNGVTGDADSITLTSGELVETAGCRPWHLVG